VISLADTLNLEFALIHTDRHVRPSRPITRSTSPVQSDAATVASSVTLNSRSVHGRTDSTVSVHTSTDASEQTGQVFQKLPVHHLGLTHLQEPSGTRSEGSHLSAAPSVYGDSDSEDESISRPVMEVDVSGVSLVGQVKGKTAIVLDDMIDGCQSFLQAANHLARQGGAKRVYLIATHGLLSGDALQEIEDSAAVHAVVVCNTFPINGNRATASSKLHTIDVSGVLSEAIRRTHPQRREHIIPVQQGILDSGG